MDIAFEELPPIETREARHVTHFRDYDDPDVESHLLRVGKKPEEEEKPGNEPGKKQKKEKKEPHNTFYVEIAEDLIRHNVVAKLFPQFEETLDVDLRDVVEWLDGKYDSVSLFGFRKSQFDHLWGLQNKWGGEDYIRLYQRPRNPRSYDAMLKRYEEATLDLTYRQLTPDDMPSVLTVFERWYKEKERKLTETLQSHGVPSEKELGDHIRAQHELIHYKQWSSPQEEKEIRKKYRELMAIKHSLERLEQSEVPTHEQNPAISFYGAFVGSGLAAYTITKGNDHFQSFQSRAAYRMNLFPNGHFSSDGTFKYEGQLSPQDYLDIQVAREFARRGVKVFDRGEFSSRKGARGLVTYKQKLGRITGVRELVVKGAYVDRDSDMAWLAKNFGVE